ncbi:MAG TPA: DUF481 domain-containing protein [Planctomycetota bacterium]|nr:DUF481 domain-containing protein [Planctomycetota bacterium]
MHRHLLLLLAASVCTALVAAEPAPAPALAPEPEPIEPPPLWSSDGKAGAFLSSIITKDTTTSRDPSIAGANETLAYRLGLEAGLDYRAGTWSFDQDFLGKYGRTRDEGEEWIEDTDEVRYDAVGRYAVHVPHHLYVRGGWESVFTGPEPEEYPFEPGLLKAGFGYALLLENLLPEKDKLELRVGPALRKRYGRILTAYEKETETGLEGFFRYERTQNALLRYFVQYEAFAEFEDFAHVTHLVTAGLTAQLATYLTAELGLRAYYESEPEDAPAGSVGYDEWGVRQDTLLGLTYTW